jgi:hypothetical protein
LFRIFRESDYISRDLGRVDGLTCQDPGKLTDFRVKIINKTRSLAEKEI